MLNRSRTEGPWVCQLGGWEATICTRREPGAGQGQSYQSYRIYIIIDIDIGIDFDLGIRNFCSQLMDAMKGGSLELAKVEHIVFIVAIWLH